MTADGPQDGWRRGPDPDRPPWAERRSSPDDRDADDAEDTADADEDRGGGDPEHGPAGSPPDGSDEEATTALAELAPGLAPPPPPRRTGVFIDPEDLRAHVGALLRVVLGGHEVDAFGNFTFTHEGARVFVTVGPSPIGPQVGVFCVTNLDLDLTQELATFLLTTNHTLGFGAFSYDPNNRAIWLRHTLLGTTLDLPELRAAVAAVATTASQLDDAIRDRFGGRTFQEAPNDVQRRMEPPEPTSEPRPPSAGGYL